MQSSTHREQLYDIFADPSEAFEKKVGLALDVGARYLDLPIGFLTRIRGDTQEIVHSVGDHDLIQPGETCPLDEAYCRRTIEIEGQLAVQNARVSKDVSESALQRFELGTYIGAKVVRNDEVYGTVCFADHDQRDTEFTEAETYFIELLARLVGQTLERRAYEQQLRQRERELEKRRELYRTIIDASFDLVFRIDPDGRFTYVSPPIEDLLGYPPDYYVGHPFTGMLPDEGTVDLAGDLFEQVMSGHTVEQQYFPLDHRADKRVFVDVRVTPIYDAGVPQDERGPDDIVGAQGMARDATERYRRDRLIRVLNRVLRHNLRNEMTVISGFAEELRDRVADENRVLADRIIETSDQLLTLSETARKFESHLESAPDLERVDVVPVVRRVAVRVDEQYPDASVHVAAPESAVALSAPRLETAVRELAENAAVHAGEFPTIELGVSTSDDHVTVVVEDDGPGLPEQERQVLADGEETSLVHGSGLGLWLVYWIAQSLDGTLTVRSGDGGTSVELRLQRPHAA